MMHRVWRKSDQWKTELFCRPAFPKTLIGQINVADLDPVPLTPGSGMNNLDNIFLA
jgi:hypothetical protein